MPLTKCVRCDKLFNKTANPICPQCVPTEDEDHQLVRDCMEENPDRLIQKAGELRLLGVPLFIFQEGAEPSAKSCFQRMADVSGGAYASFDNSSADQLRDLLKAVAIYAGGGLSALQQFSQIAHPAVARLSHQLGGKS